MLVIAGYLITILSVFGGYCLSGGQLSVLIQPFEFLIITGAATGSFVVGNSMKVIKATIRSVISVLKGSSYTKKFYIELLSLYYELANKIKKDGVLSIESDVEDYKNSPLFSRYKLVLKEKIIMEFMCDHLRLIVTGRIDVHHLEGLLDEDIDTFQSEEELPIAAISKVADSLPAFGIVAAVMGVVITMKSISSPPEVLGEHIAKALVGTFLGVLIGYGFTGPIASVLETKLHATITVMQSVKVVLLASVHKLAPTIAVEFARKLLYSSDRPTGVELEAILKDVKSNKTEEASESSEVEPV